MPGGVGIRAESLVNRRGLSRRGFLRWAGQGAAAVAWLSGCDTPVQNTAPSGTAPAPSTPAATPSPGTTGDVSLDVKIGQMLMIGFRGLEVNETHFIVRDIQERHLGGVVLFDYDVPSQQPVRNIESPQQVQELVGSLQAFSAIPLLVAVDHEGGLVTRLKEAYGFPPTMSHQALGEADSPEVTYGQASAMAETLHGLGINWNLAPVVDLNLNPRNPIIARYERSFSADPALVVTHALEFIRAHHEQGVCCTLKHFPGHGSATGDSHLGWVDVTDTWSPVELQPYREIISAGQADAIMTAHVFQAGLDPDDPATLSRSIVTDLLRGEMDYDGVVVSDDMQMGAIVERYGPEAAAQKAIEAGVDVIAYANNSTYEEDIAARMTALIRRLVEDGLVDEARIDASYRRICRLKGSES